MGWSSLSTRVGPFQQRFQGDDDDDDDDDDDVDDDLTKGLFDGIPQRWGISEPQLKDLGGNTIHLAIMHFIFLWVFGSTFHRDLAHSADELDEEEVAESSHKKMRKD